MKITADMNKVPLELWEDLIKIHIFSLRALGKKLGWQVFEQYLSFYNVGIYKLCILQSVKDYITEMRALR